MTPEDVLRGTATAAAERLSASEPDVMALLTAIAAADTVRLAAALVPVVRYALEHLHGEDWPAVVTAGRAVFEDRR